MLHRRPLGFALVLYAISAVPVPAQVVGTFSWQMQPYCNSVQLTLISMPTGFTLEGVDDQCGGASKGSVVGTASFNAAGTVTLNFTIGLPSATPVQVTAFVSPVNGEGTWADSGGHSGTFKFFGTQAGLPPRPSGAVFFRAASHALTTSGGFRVVFTDVTNNSGGGAYNTSTGVYTVPTAGIYSITYSVAYDPGTVTGGRACAYVRTTTVAGERVSCVPFVANSGYLVLTGATVMSLASGETISVETTNQGAGGGLAGAGGGLTVLRMP